MIRQLNLITRSNQNYLIWDGLDHQGKRVGTGVYFIKIATANKNYSEKVIVIQ